MNGTEILSFPEVQRAYELSQSDPYFKGMDLQQFSKFMNQQTGTGRYSAGDVGKVGRSVKRISSYIDEGIRPISEPSGQLGAALGGLVSPKGAEIGQRVGQAFPRIAAGTALTLGGLAAEPFSAGTSTGATLAGLGLIGLGTADTMAKTYTDTGSAGAASVAGATNLLLPAVGGAGARFATKLAAPVGRAVERAGVGPALAGLTERGIEYGGSQLAATGLSEVSSQAQSKLATGQFYNPLTAEHLAETVAGNLPFAAFDLPRLVRGPKSGFRSLSEFYNVAEAYAGLRQQAERARSDQALRKTTETAVPTTTPTEDPNLPPAISAVPSSPQQQGTGLDPRLTQHLETLERQGADPEQLVRAIKTLTGRDPDDYLRSVGYVDNYDQNGQLTGVFETKTGRFVPLGSAESLPPHIQAHVRYLDKVVAAERLAGIHRPVRETPDERAFRISGFERLMNTKADPNELLQSVHDYFYTKFLQNGEAPERAAYLTQQTMKVAAMYQETAAKQASVIGARESDTTRANFALPNMGPLGRSFVAMLGNTGYFNAKSKLGNKQMDQFARMWILGHELTHINEQGALAGDASQMDPKKVTALQNAIRSAYRMNPEQHKEAMRFFMNALVPPEFRESGALENYIARYDQPITGPSEFVADLAGLLSLAGASPKGSHIFKSANDILFFGDNETQNFAGGLYRDISNIMEGTRDFFKKIGKLRGAENDDIVQSLDEIHSNLQSLLVTKQEAEAAVDAFMSTMERRGAGPTSDPVSLSYEEAQALFSKFRNDIPLGMRRSDAPELDALGREAADVMLPNKEVGGKRISWWQRLMPFTQLARWYPELKGVSDLGLAYHSMVTNKTFELWSAFADDKGKIHKDLIRRVGQEGTAINKVFNEIALNQQLREHTLWDPTQLKQEFPSFAKLPENDQKAVVHALEKFGEVASRAANMRVKAHRDEIAYGAARVLQAHDRTMAPDEAIRLGQQMLSAFFDTAVVSPTHPDFPEVASASLAAQAELAAKVKSKSGLETATRVVQESIDPHLKLQKQLFGEDLKGKQWYMPEVRLGEWIVAWKPKAGEKQLWGFKSKAEADAKYQELLKKYDRGELDYLKSMNKYDDNERFRGINRDLLDLYREADERLYNSVLNAIQAVGDPETVAQIQAEFRPGDGAARVTTSPYMLQRGEPVGGRERINMVEGMIHYINATAHGIAKRNVKQQQAVYLNDPKLRANKNLQNAADRYLSSITDPTGSEFTTMKNLIFFNYMGFNPSSLPVELTQQILTLVPHLVSKGSGVGNAYKTLADAWGSVGKFYTKGAYDDPELQSYVAQAKNNRVIDTGVIQDLYATEDVDFVNTKNLISGNGKLASARDVVSKPLYHVLKLARDFYGLATRFNSEVAFVSSYKFARNKLGLSPERANAFATDAVRTTMFGGGVANRPLALSGLGKAQGVGGVMYSLQGYTFNMLSMLARLSRDAIGRSSLGPAEKLAARKAAGLAFGTQFLMGGVMGMPFVAAGTALVDQIFPEAQVKKNLRGAFFGLAGDDEEMGHMVADGAMNGVFNTVPGGADVGSRFQLGNMLGVSPYDGFSWKNLVGPAASMLENYTKAGQAAVRGEGSQVAESLVPTGSKALVRLLADDWQMRDRREQLMFEPTTTEKSLLALGFKPKRYNQYLERKALMEQAERTASQEQTRFHQDLAERLMAGDAAGVQRELYAKQLANPLYDVRAGLAQVVEMVQERSIPHDPRREGTLGSAAQRSDILGLYPPTVNTPETTRLEAGYQLESAVGIPMPPPSPAEYRQAILVDQLMQQNSSLTRPAALALVQRMLQPRTSYGRFPNQ